MSEPLLNVVTDADGWPDTITLTQTYDFTSPDGKERKTGTATFTYTRASLADVLASPKLFFDLNNLPVPGSAEFLPVQYALGKMPGWQVLFGDQPIQADAFTTTYTNDAGHVTKTYSNANCLLGMACALCAPGRPAYVARDQPESMTFLGINGSLGIPYDDSQPDVAFTVESIYAGSVATPTAPEVGPVFRVTIPSDVAGIGAMTVVLNGASTPLDLGDLGGYITENGNLLGALLGGLGTADPRSPYVCEVQLPHLGDELAAGTLSYYRSSVPGDSYLVATPGGTITLDDPFNLLGRSFEARDDSSGLTVTVSF